MEEKLNKTENIFRNSTSPDLLFDAFQEAIKQKVKNPEIFKILLGNPALSTDEIKMFVEKLIKEFPSYAYELSIWAARIFEHNNDYHNSLEDTVHYYKRAHDYKPDSFESLIRLLQLYNYELDLPANKVILELVETRISAVQIKSKVYYALADHYKKIGDKQLEGEFLLLAEKSFRLENK
ncbi:MAG: hypothetical protein WC879_06695 [Melioribacteraceae bacterium]